MRPKMSFALLLLASATMAPALAADQGDGLSAQELLRAYRSYARLMPEPREVSFQLAMLCSIPSEQVYAQDRERYGVHSLARVYLYANPAARAALDQPNRKFAPGAIIVEEKLGEHEKVIGVSAMQKMAPGYDPEGGDWKYLYSADGQLSEGRLDNCRSCHLRAKESDNVHFGAQDPQSAASLAAGLLKPEGALPSLVPPGVR